MKIKRASSSIRAIIDPRKGKTPSQPSEIETMKAVKSIFDKSYIVEAQAIKAGEKEWPQGLPFGFDIELTFDAATRKYRWVKAPQIAPAGWTEVEAGEELHPELAAAELQMPANVTFEQALKESGESLEDLKDGDRIANATMAGAAPFVMPENCPHCGIGLDNGIGHHDQDVNGKLVKHTKFQYECLGCGEEFGPAIGAKLERPRLSTAMRPTRLVWVIADSMPKASRKEVMAECVAQGVAYGTARTQYQAWFKASQEGSKIEVRRPYEKGEK